MKGGPIKYAIATTFFYAALTAATLWLAGSWTLGFFWAVFAAWYIISMIGSFVLDPGLIAERIKPPKGEDKDPLGVPVISVLWSAQLVLAAMDVGHWHISSALPFVLQLGALLVMFAAWLALLWTMITNKFFSSAIRLQTDRGQHVVAKGPYAFIRHPGYAFSSVGLIAESLALGSWISVVPAVFIVSYMVYRTILEEKLLTVELPGYTEYTAQVPYKWLPKVW